MSRVWLITGCSKGLGRALAEAVLADGDRLVATARNPTQLADLADRYGDQVRTVALDVTDPAAARTATSDAVDVFGSLDILVNNAGYADVAAIEDMSEDAFRAQIEANFFGVVNLSRAALPAMRRQGRGHIVQISSVGSRVASIGLGAYQAAKWAVGGFSAVLAREVESFGIRITVVEPGALRTEWAGSSMSALPISEPYRPVIEPASSGCAGPTAPSRAIPPAPLRRSSRSPGSTIRPRGCCSAPTPWRLPRRPPTRSPRPTPGGAS
ncbi:SDR family NAD(P)-dependent oxidoreductase [Micromonospora parastrephiae]|uniref:SDR family NAD(P)-dependent oxidoreductase n=1 Tax=Micromonospora parastrephiae TaxID=2806101 RepID=UPI0028161104|nr:SDR family NAD(P)-dependent oxidoreductase [Micromonospora parastrephiae]